MTGGAEVHLARGAAGCALAARLGGVAVVVDALRASTTLAVLLDRGVSRILVTAAVADARSLAAEAPGAVLAGEREGERLPGFDLGNSPLEALSAGNLAGRTVAFTSSNGAQRLAACAAADRVLLGSLANASAVSAWAGEYARAARAPVILIAAGRYPDEAFISPEDEAACACLCGRTGLPVAAGSQARLAHWEGEIARRGLEAIFRTSPHALRLMAIGYEADVDFCARLDTCASLPGVVGPARLRGREVGVEVRNIPDAIGAG